MTNTTRYQLAAADYRRVTRAIQYVEEHFQEQPSLAEIAASTGLSDFHFQRLFGRWVGISPKRFLQFLTKEYAKGLLEQSENLLDVAYASGLSGPGRLHDLFVSCEAVTPGEFKSRGDGLTIRYGFSSSPFGKFLLAGTDRGICGFVFVEEGGRKEALELLRSDWQRARFVADTAMAQRRVEALFGKTADQGTEPLHLFLKGTNFQLKVWEALLRIPPGRVVSYEELATHVGEPTATRAVANAVGKNPVPFLIPCHRVIRKTGEFGGYRFGSERKRALLAWEAARYGHREAS